MRRDFDAYNTPEMITRVLLDRIQPEGTVYECCVGKGNISSVLRGRGFKVLTNDLDKSIKAHRHVDASIQGSWDNLEVDWTITNPPFGKAANIVQLAYTNSRVGIAMLLRLSFLEPCKDRVDFLMQHPPTAIYVLPRISWTDDGRKDTVTAMWAVWDKRVQSQIIGVVGRTELKG